MSSAVQDAVPGCKRSSVDRGWSWAVLGASCLMEMLLGLIYVLGIFNIFFLEIFDKDKQTTAWIGAVQTSLLSLLGPIAGYLNERIGPRKTAIIGGILTSVGFFLTYFATNFLFLFFTFGILVGAGNGLAYLPCIVIIGSYFKRYRNFAFGAVNSAAGIGTVALAPLIQFLEEQYGWRGCMLILAGLYLHMILAGAFFRQQNTLLVENEQTDDIRDSTKSDPAMMEPSLKQSKPHNWFTASLLSVTSLSSCGQFSSTQDLKTHTGKQLHASFTHIPTNTSSVLHQISSQSCQEINVSMHGMIQDSCNGTKIALGQSEKPIVCNKDETSKSDQSKSLLDSKLTSDDLCTPVLNMPDERTDIHVSKSRHKHMSILCDSKLIIFYIHLFCLTTATVMIFIHFPAYFKLCGATSSDLSILLMLTGLSSIACRLLVGAVTNFEGISVILICMGSGGIAGLFILFCPLMVKEFTGQAIFVIGFGFYGNTYSALLAPMSLELCKLEHLSMVYGINLAVCGVGSLVGPPLAGWFYDITGNYAITFYTAGALFTIGSLVLMFIPMLKEKSLEPVTVNHEIT